MNGPSAPQRLDAQDLPGLGAPSGNARLVLDAAQHDPHLARVLNHIALELDDRLRTDAEDRPDASADDLVAGRYRVLAGMARRYRLAADSGTRRRRSDAALMLAAMHRLAGSGRLRAV
jgi:hypothetical protein